MDHQYFYGNGTFAISGESTAINIDMFRSINQDSLDEYTTAYISYDDWQIISHDSYNTIRDKYIRFISKLFKILPMMRNLSHIVISGDYPPELIDIIAQLNKYKLSLKITNRNYNVDMSILAKLSGLSVLKIKCNTLIYASTISMLTNLRKLSLECDSADGISLYELTNLQSLVLLITNCNDVPSIYDLPNLVSVHISFDDTKSFKSKTMEQLKVGTYINQSTPIELVSKLTQEELIAKINHFESMQKEMISKIDKLMGVIVSDHGLMKMNIH